LLTFLHFALYTYLGKTFRRLAIMVVESSKQTNAYSLYPTTTTAQKWIVLQYRECVSNTKSAYLGGFYRGSHSNTRHSINPCFWYAIPYQKWCLEGRRGAEKRTVSTTQCLTVRQVRDNVESWVDCRQGRKNFLISKGPRPALRPILHLFLFLLS
jgi:hypothetical protein